jgi:hypothetical protein
MKSKQVGIWLDYRKAWVVQIDQKEKKLVEIFSNIEDFHPVGGSRSKTPWGPQDKMAEPKYLERRKHQTKLYLQAILELVKDADELILTGPAQAKIDLQKYVSNRKGNKPLILGTIAADSMTKNQAIARLKALFEKAKSQ